MEWALNAYIAIALMHIIFFAFVVSYSPKFDDTSTSFKCWSMVGGAVLWPLYLLVCLQNLTTLRMDDD